MRVLTGEWSPMPTSQLPSQECAHSFGLLTTGSEKRGVDFHWGQEKIRGVNIGGWLVLEP